MKSFWRVAVSFLFFMSTVATHLKPPMTHLQANSPPMHTHQEGATDAVNLTATISDDDVDDGTDEKSDDGEENYDNATLPEETPKQAAVLTSYLVNDTQGFPTLPTVSTILGSASETMRSVTEEAAKLQAHLAKINKQSQIKTANQKAAFEQKLRTQEKATQKITTTNGNLLKDIQDLQKSNDNIQRKIKDLGDKNRAMKAEVRFVEAKLGSAKDFAEGTLRMIDSKADDEDRVDDEETIIAGPSFLTISSKRTSLPHHKKVKYEVKVDSDDTKLTSEEAPSEVGQTEAKNLINVLAQGVNDVTKEEKASEMQLASMFEAAFKAGSQRRDAQLMKQKKLQQEKSSLQQLQKKLRAEEQHLEVTRAHLQERLRGLGLYMQSLSQVALAPENDVQRLEKDLPESVRSSALPLPDSAVAPHA